MRKMMTIKPYEHDCERCKWVGWYYHPGSDLPANVYLCGSTVVIRVSDEPSDYWSRAAGDTVKGGISYLYEEMFDRHSMAIQKRKAQQMEEECEDEEEI